MSKAKQIKNMKTYKKIRHENLIKIILRLISIILFLPVSAYADAGVPMIYLSYPAMLLALLPVILIETSIFKRIVNIPYKKSFKSNVAANAVSTVAGFPLAWAFLFAVEYITTGFSCGPGFDTIPNSIITVFVEAAWLCPHDKHLYWLIPTAFIISLIVAFCISLVIEYFVNKRFHKEIEKKEIRKAVYISNISSYCVLIFGSVGYLIFSILSRT